MLINALCEYYDRNLKDGVLPECFSMQKANYMIMLTPDGEVSDIIDIRVPRTITGKKGKPKQIFDDIQVILPKRSQKTCIDLNIIEHRPLYIFGLNYDAKNDIFTPDDKTDKAKKSNACFVKGNLEFCEGLSSEIVTAYCNFLKAWNPAEQTENPVLHKIRKDYSTSNFIFALDGHPEIKLHEDSELLDKFKSGFGGSADENVVTAFCPIEGQTLPVARIHDKIKGIKGGNSTGGVLVGINDTAFESYGKTQSYNSNISEAAMKKYTASLNNLLSDKNHHIFAEEMTIVYFATKKDDIRECELFDELMSGDDDKADADTTDSMLDKLMKTALNERPALFTAEGIDENVIFYVVGLTPNSSRISQKFIVRNKFGAFIDNILQHHKDMSVSENGRIIPLWAIQKELVSPKSSNQKVPSPLISDIFSAVLNGTNYPTALLETVVRRVKTDSDEEDNSFIKLNNTRIGIIKACLNRKARLKNQKEEITMSLDETNVNPAYLCGRLFAVYEAAQKLAAKDKLNRTIRDAYFASACSRPATVFPKLDSLSKNHIPKITNEESRGRITALLSSIYDNIDKEFPKTLSVEEQGKFIIGYQHQSRKLYYVANGEE